MPMDGGEMNISLSPIKITVTKTADGSADYVQIMSDDQFAVNIVMISSKITVLDTRKGKK